MRDRTVRSALPRLVARATQRPRVPLLGILALSNDAVSERNVPPGNINGCTNQNMDAMLSLRSDMTHRVGPEAWLGFRGTCKKSLRRLYSAVSMKLQTTMRRGRNEGVSAKPRCAIRFTLMITVEVYYSVRSEEWGRHAVGR